ncbi:MAG: hypothetical protein AB7F86_10185 [Bdellovibrionales bacterium]
MKTGVRGWVIAVMLLSGGSVSAQLEDWQKTMRTMSQSLVDGFPFFYSLREYRDGKNQKAIARHLEVLAKTVHALPVQKGKMLIGAEPLIESAQVDMKAEFEQALAAFKAGNLARSQEQVHSAIGRCFACHTAHQVGPVFQTTNAEVAGIVTPFTLGKATVFGALRQFGGAMDLIEGKAFHEINKDRPETDPLVKLHLVVSLRATQNFDRAAGFVQKLAKLPKAESPAQKILLGWLQDIAAWRTLAATPEKEILHIDEQLAARKGQSLDSQFVLHLWESLSAHRQLSSGKQKSKSYARLGRVYQEVNFPVLAGLSDIYYRACAKADPKGPIGRDCLAKVSPP